MMNRRVFAAIAVLSLAPLLTGCQQATGPMNSPLTPVGSFGVDQLSPVQTTSGVGPLGGSTRVQPPPTRGYSVPNNYMGGNGQASNQFSAQGGSFANQTSGQLNNGWVQKGQLSFDGNNQPSVPTFGGSFASQPQPSAVAGFSGPGSNPIQGTAQRPQSGGMRVIDLTGAPSPPNYQPAYNGNPNTVQIPGGQLAANGFAGNGSVQNTFGQNTFGQNTFGQNTFGQGTTFRQDTIASSNGLGMNVAPASFEAAAAPTSSAPMNAVPAREFPMHNSPTEPSFNGTSNFPANRPSTDPVNVNEIPNDDGLSWRRPF